MGVLSGLEGVKGDLPAWYSGSPSKVVKDIQTHRACTAAGDDGAINVWKDDAGKLRCEFCWHQMTIAKEQPKTKKALRAWLDEWWPKMRRD